MLVNLTIVIQIVALLLDQLILFIIKLCSFQYEVQSVFLLKIFEQFYLLLYLLQ